MLVARCLLLDAACWRTKTSYKLRVFCQLVVSTIEFVLKLGYSTEKCRHCEYTVASLPSSSPQEKYDWPARLYVDKWNSHSRAFAVSGQSFMLQRMLAEDRGTRRLLR